MAFWNMKDKDKPEDTKSLIKAEEIDLSEVKFRQLAGHDEMRHPRIRRP